MVLAVGFQLENLFTKDTLPIILFMIGVGIIIWRLGRARRNQLAKRKEMEQTPGRSAEPAAKSPTVSELRSMSEDLNRYIVELHETSRRIAAQIDNRTTKLDLLIQEADEKIKTLEALQGGKIAGENSRKRAGGSDPDHNRTGTPEANTQERTGADFLTPPPVLGDDTKHKLIYELADRGKMPREIAQALNASPGEVELILNLRGKR